MAADCAGRFQMAQKPGQVLVVVPEPEQLLHRLMYGDALFDLDACAMFDARAKSFALRGADAQGLVEIAMAGRASIDQGPAGDRHQQPAEAAALQTVYRQSASARRRNEPLAVADVDWPVMTAAFGYIRHCITREIALSPAFWFLRNKCNLAIQRSGRPRQVCPLLWLRFLFKDHRAGLKARFHCLRESTL